MLIAMAGLPGTGKSTVARAVAAALVLRGRAVTILDKDEVRAALFPPDTVEYSREQDDLCVDVMLQVASFLLRRDPDRVVLLDGRTFSRRYQVERVVTEAATIPTPVHFVECTCREETALARLVGDQREARHPAENRDADLYQRVRSQAQALQAPHHLVVDTEKPPSHVADRVVHYLNCT